MSEDEGLWLVNGKVSSAKEYERVWTAYKRIRECIWQRIHAEEERHQQKIKRLRQELDASPEPRTIWVGRADEGAVPRFVSWAKRDYKHYQEELRVS